MPWGFHTSNLDNMNLNGDALIEILRRGDGITLAKAGCVCSEFWCIAKQESLWEEACCSLWPKMADKHVRELISSSMGGYRNLYANCFPLIANTHDKNNLHNASPMSNSAVPSDFVSVVDVYYKNKVVYSKVVWGISGADDCEDWFSNFPFRIDLINYSDTDTEDEEDHTAAAKLPAIMCVEKQSKDDKVWGELEANTSLSWIVINRRTGRAANLSSWRPLVGKKNWLSDKEFVIRFGCILPAHDILPCKDVHCKLVLKCRHFDSDSKSVKITELSMQFEDVMGSYVNGKKSMIILERALDCKKSKDHSKNWRVYQNYVREQSEFRKAKIRREGRLNSLWIISGMAVGASLWYFTF